MNLRGVQLRHAYVLLRRLKLKQEGELILPGDSYGNFMFGEIINIGPGNPTIGDARRDDATGDLKVGDVVIFRAGIKGNPMQGRPNEERTLPFKLNGEKVDMINEGDIIAIVQGDFDHASD